LIEWVKAEANLSSSFLFVVLCNRSPNGQAFVPGVFHPKRGMFHASDFSIHGRRNEGIGAKYLLPI
jgi:hypothetical protein